MKPAVWGEREVYDLMLGELVAQLRSRQGLSQGEVADRCGLTQSTFSRIERGQASAVLSTLRALAPALGLADHVEFFAILDDVWTRTGCAAATVIGQPADEKDWWTPALQRGTPVGVSGLLRFAVACVLRERAGPNPAQAQAQR